MNRLRAALVVASASLLTGGCVAAAIPAVAGSMIARNTVRESAQAEEAAAKATAQAAQRTVQSGSDTVAGEATGSVVPTTLKELPPPVTSGGEDAAMTLQAYQGLWTYLAAQAAKRKAGETVRSVVLAEGSTLDAPRYVPCGDHPIAVLIDVDENPAKSADPDARWRRWHGDERDAIVATPGAVEGVEAARREGVTVIFTSARSPESATGVAAALERTGFGKVEPGRTLFLRGATPADANRRSIAATHCVVALVGDALEDFSDLLPAMDAGAMQTAAVTDTMIAPLWGAGWFMLPNAVRSMATPSNNPSGGN